MTRRLSHLLCVVLIACVVIPSATGDDQDNGTALALEIKTIEVMVDQLEKMPRGAWSGLWLDIIERIKKLNTYANKDNLDLWIVVGQWAVTSEARTLFEEAYRKGCSRGAKAIAAMYREGIGVSRSETAAGL